MNNINPSQQLIAPYVRVTIGPLQNTNGDSFTIGDSKLINCSVTLGEGEVQSSYRFTVRDKDRTLLDKYFGYIEKAGGLTPIEPTNNPPREEITSPTLTPPEPDQTSREIGLPVFNNVQATTYGYGEPTQGGQIGAYGDRINWDGMYAAMYDRKYKYARMKVTNLANDKQIIVKIVDRGPFAVVNGRAARPLREHPTRKIDLVPGAWKALTDNASPGVINVNIEWLEAETTTASSSNKNKSLQEVNQKAAQASKGASINNNKILDWPLPAIAATKSIILTPGHIADGSNSSGTNGTHNSSVTYKGETRTLEFVANDITVEVFRIELQKAGYNVINAPTPPTERSDAARRAYLDQVKELKERNNAYALEIHFDSPNGRPGIIAGAKYEPSGKYLSIMDVALAKEFGAFPFNHRDSLSAPSRGITILEVSPLNSTLTNITLNAVNSGNYQPLRDVLLPFAQRAVKALNTVAPGANTASNGTKKS
ncbi:lipoprotein [Nostoc sp. PCC 7524]|uniref:septal ring lytic transglycosylase RlpA family protein n=1 Tax=Nostoc sp. (strain ATCC 29411 / PCC 7524) TaxID=28072 RepID=UPI00029EE2DB|nr:septal ring lytic transglycosylase RlpA family protein [Nostoc sp. PCC 7524]AFY49012.1 lipoprotein [Nostoc sp. PCC 7524]